MKELILQIYKVNCPISLRIKYWLRAYTLETKFYKDMNSDLMKGNIKPYIPYIQLLYSGLKLNNFNFSNTNDLFRGALIKIEEIDELKKLKYMNDIVNWGIPRAFIFSNAFMSFSLDKNVALDFMKRKEPRDNEVRVLYILKTEQIIDKNATNADLSEISLFEDEKEILLFPFSVYEIADIQEENGYYIIYLNILGKYKKKFKYEFQKKPEFIYAINQSNYIQMLQKIGLLPIISDIAIIVLHFTTTIGKRFSLVCKTSDKLSNIIEIIFDKFQVPKDTKYEEIVLLYNAMILRDYSKTLEQVGLRDDASITIIDQSGILGQRIN